MDAALVQRLHAGRAARAGLHRQRARRPGRDARRRRRRRDHRRGGALRRRGARRALNRASSTGHAGCRSRGQPRRTRSGVGKPSTRQIPPGARPSTAPLPREPRRPCESSNLDTRLRGITMLKRALRRRCPVQQPFRPSRPPTSSRDGQLREPRRLGAGSYDTSPARDLPRLARRWPSRRGSQRPRRHRAGRRRLRRARLARRTARIATSFSTVAGQAYSLTFYYSGRAHQRRATTRPFAGGVVPGSSDGLSVTVGRRDRSTSPRPPTRRPTTVWTPYTATFIGTGKSMSLLFAATGTATRTAARSTTSACSPCPNPRRWR